PAIRPEVPAFLSAFTFPAAIRDHMDARDGSTADYLGPVGVEVLHFDIDRPDDLDLAIRDARRLAAFLADRCTSHPLVYYSGSKGFHVDLAIPGVIPPSPDAHEFARDFALRLAGAIDVTIDTGVFDRVRLWRAPNSRHDRSGLYKVRI